MNPVRIRRTLESDTLYLPEIKPLIGKTVEILIREENKASAEDPGRFAKICARSSRSTSRQKRRCALC